MQSACLVRLVYLSEHDHGATILWIKERGKGEGGQKNYGSIVWAVNLKIPKQSPMDRGLGYGGKWRPAFLGRRGGVYRFTSPLAGGDRDYY